MKLKTKINRDNLLSTPPRSKKQHSNLENDSSDDECSTFNKKRKASPSSQGDNSLDQPKHKRKFKSEKDFGNETHNSLDQPKHKRKFKSEKDFSNETHSHSEHGMHMLGESSKEVESEKQDNTPESLRKKKKLKKRKCANPAVAKSNDSILDYLRKWKNDRGNWKFEKVKQIRLISNMFENEKLPDDYFSIFLEYMEGGSKSVKDLMSKLANKVVDEKEKWESLSDAEKETTPKVNENKYERARTVLQMLQ